MGRNPNEITIGKKYGFLTVIGKDYSKNWIHWKCKCLCNKEVIVQSSDLIRGHSKSCGCRGIISKDPARRVIYNNYKRQARRRKIKFELTRKEFSEIINRNCFYCGSKPEQIIDKPGLRDVLKYNGIDRVNNKKGYTTENSVACCGSCNFAKNKKSLNKFLKWLSKAYKYQRLLGNIS